MRLCLRIPQAAIERETMADAQAILERLRSAEALKKGALDQRLAVVATELEALDRLARQVADVTATGSGGGNGGGGGGGADKCVLPCFTICCTA